MKPACFPLGCEPVDPLSRVLLKFIPPRQRNGDLSPAPFAPEYGAAPTEFPTVPVVRVFTSSAMDGICTDQSCTDRTAGRCLPAVRRRSLRPSPLRLEWLLARVLHYCQVTTRFSFFFQSTDPRRPGRTPDPLFMLPMRSIGHSTRRSYRCIGRADRIRSPSCCPGTFCRCRRGSRFVPRS